jgi:pimeloyl-ACP methyl ester carboxylesterase
MTEPETRTLDAPGAVLHYDVRGNGAGTRPVLLLIGSAMGAAGFVALAGHFTDRTVVTYDPRGAGAASVPTAPRRPRSRSRPTICTG